MPKAPQAPPAQWTPMVLPYKGIDRSVVHALRPPGTTDFAENVRLTCPRTGRRGLARRAPLTKLWTEAVGDANTAGTHINHLAALPVRGEGSRTTAGRYVTVTDDFVGLLQRTTTAYASDLNRRSAAVNVGSDPALLPNRDLVGFRREYHGGSPHYVKSFVQQRIQTTPLDGTPDLEALAPGVDGGLVVSWIDSADGGYPGVSVVPECVNDVTVQMYAARTATDVNNGAGDVGEPQGYGPYIRGSGDLSQYIGACLLRTGSNEVKLSIVLVNGATRTTLVQSEALAIPAPNDAWGDEDTQGNPDLFIRIYENGGVIRAICQWPSAGVGDADSPGDLGGGSGRSIDSEIGGGGGGTPGDGDETADNSLTCSTSNTTLLGNKGVGMAALFTSGGSGSADSCADRWYIRSITYTKIVPPDVVVIGDCDRNSPLPPDSSYRYYVPEGCIAVGLTTGGTVQTANAAWFVLDDDLTGRIHPYKDQRWPVIKGNTAASRSSFVQISPTYGPDGVSFSGRPQVEVRGRYDPLTGLDSSSDTEDICGAMLRCYTDYKSCILIEVFHTATTGSETDPYLGKAHQDHYTTIRFVGVANGARTVLETYAVATQHMPPFHASHWQRWEDGGQTLANLVVKWKIAGRTYRTFPALSAMSGWATYIAALDALSAGAVTTYMNTSKLCGISFWGDDAPNPPNLNCWGGRIVDNAAETAGTRTLGEDTSILLAFTTGRVSVGSISGGTPRTLATGLLFNAGVRSAFLGPILYVTDGTDYYYIDGTATLIVGVPRWTALTAGTIPPGCRLICSWRGSIVLARSDADTTSYFISRLLDPFDWDYGADPFETAAFAGNSSAQGQPAQPITALMPGPDDILFIGCAGQILAMQGDPRTGGQLVVAEPNIGVLGPDAWCFDDKGNLYFVSGSGLYRIPRGSVGAQNVDQDRMGELLTDIDSSAMQIILKFSPIERCIYIYRTTVVTATANRHIVYDVEADAFFEDRYDGGDGSAPEMNPFSAVVPISSVPEERTIYTGGSDGWVRRYVVDSDNDERTSTTAGISSGVDIYAPDSSGVTEVMVEKLRLEGYTNSGTVALRWFVANAQNALAEQVVGDAVVSTTQALAGYCTPLSIRRTAAAQKLRITQNTSGGWFLVERIAMSVSSRGRRR